MLRACCSVSRTVVILVVTAVFFGPAHAAKKKDAVDAPPVLLSTKGGGPKWKNAAELRQFALHGDPQACFQLGAQLLEGEGVAQDVSQAIGFLEVAARGGVANAWFRLGKIYHDGLAGPPDYARALDHYTRAACLGVTEAQHNIGAMLVSARGVKRDYIEGLAWLIVATKSGDDSDAESQVRVRLTKRPADIAAAELRAAELQKDLPHATVRAVPTGTSIKPPTTTLPQRDVSAPVAPPAERPAMAAPKIDPIAPQKLMVPPPGKP